MFPIEKNILFFLFLNDAELVKYSIIFMARFQMQNHQNMYIDKDHDGIWQLQQIVYM